MRDQSPTVADSSAFDADPAPGERAMLAVYLGQIRGTLSPDEARPHLV